VFALHRQLAVQLRDEMLREIKTESNSRRGRSHWIIVRVRRRAVKLFEDVWQVSFRNSFARIADADCHEITGFPRGNSDTPARRRVFDRVIDKTTNHSPQGFEVTTQRGYTHRHVGF